MATTQLSSKGQVVIPKSVRQAHQWRPGTKFVVEETSGGILIRPLQPFPPTTLAGGLGCTGYGGRAKTVKEMQEGVDEAFRRRWRQGHGK
jgi:AbrB family looped-hinge helix DNA binding protein